MRPIHCTPFSELGRWSTEGSVLGGEGKRNLLPMILESAARVAGFVLANAAAPFQALRGMRIGAPDRLRIAPQDIRTADATVAHEIYSGFFSFDGKILNTRGRSPFALEPPSMAWRRSLAGFSWLRHLRVELVEAALKGSDVGQEIHAGKVGGKLLIASAARDGFINAKANNGKPAG